MKRSAPRALPAVVAALILLGTLEAAAAERFFPVDVVLDTGNVPLAAWQAEISYDREAMLLVGVEGGESPFSEAPYYDPRGLEAGRIVLASFTLADTLPRGRSIVARLHLLERRRPSRPLDARLILAAGPDGRKIAAAIFLSTAEGDRP